MKYLIQKLIEKLFINRWVTFSVLVVVVIADLIALLGKWQWSAGWVIMMAYGISAGFVKKPVVKKTKTK